jgi:hypothetical protein
MRFVNIWKVCPSLGREAKPLEMFNVSLTKWKDWELSLLGKQRGDSPMVVPQTAVLVATLVATLVAVLVADMVAGSQMKIGVPVWTESNVRRSSKHHRLQRRENAFGIISAFLQRAGLGGLETNIRGLLAQGIEDSDAILFNLRETTQFKTRFKANARRVENGLPELDPATYIGLEQEYANVLRANRLPTKFYDSPEDFEKLIEGAVSPSEFQARINEGFAKVRDADPQVLNTLRQFYPEVGNDENALAAYFIDPKRGADVLERQVQAARIGARAREQGGIGIGALTAEELVSRGYTPEVAQGVFERVGQLAGLYQEMGGEQALTEQQKVGAAFGFDVQAQEELERRRSQRVGEFQAGGQFARTTGATSGTVETGVGTAQ